MDLMNPANPLNMVNPASPWYYVWNSTDDTTTKVVETTVEHTPGISEWIGLGLLGAGILAVVVGLVLMVWTD